MKFHTALLLASASAMVLAQQAALADGVTSDGIPQITIYALRTPTPLSQIASSVTVIDEAQIEKKQAATVADALRDVPGLSVAGNGGQGQTARVFMRGAESRHVLVLMDGVALNDPSDPGAAFDFSNLTTDGIERIEVLRGPQSTLYGSQAIGGVINIISKQGRGAPKQYAKAEAGSWNSRRLAAGSAGEVGGISYSLDVGNSHTNGISAFDKKLGGLEHDGSDAYTIAATLFGQVTPNFSTKASFRYNRTVSQFDAPGSFVVPSDSHLPENDSRQINGRASGELALIDGKWTQELGVGRLYLDRQQITEYYDEFFNSYFGRQEFWGWRDNIDWVHRISLIPQHRMTLGADFSTEYFKNLTLATRNVDNRAVFASDQWHVVENLFVEMGARLDDHQSFGSQTTYKVGPSYTIAATGTRLKATYGTGFKAPSLFELYDPAYGNASVRPEKSKGYDVGFEQPLFGGRVTLGATWFHNRIDDLISIELVDSGPPAVYKSTNISKARTQGVESSIAFAPLPELSFTATHTFTQADNMLSDKRLARRPKHRVSVSADYSYSERGDVGVNVRYASPGNDIDIFFPYGSVRTKSYTVVGVTTSYKLTDSTSVYAKADNLLDKRYEEVYGYGRPGFNVMVGLKQAF